MPIGVALTWLGYALWSGSTSPRWHGPQTGAGCSRSPSRSSQERTGAKGLRERRGALAGLPAAIVRGMRDPLFGRRFLAHWREALPSAEVVTWPGVGRFVPEEEQAKVIRALRRLIATASA